MTNIPLTVLLQEAIQQALQTLFNLAVPKETITLQPTRKEFEGTHTFVTFSLAKDCNQTPEAVATQLGTWLQQNNPLIASFNTVKGFLNLQLTDSIWLQQFNTMYRNPQFGCCAPNGQKIVIEYSSPNTNKPLHLGHLRNNFLGHAISNILQAVGYKVYKVNLVNDRGIHICKSMVAYQHWGKGETPQSSQLKGDHLVGQYYVMFDKAYKEQVAALIATGKQPEEAAQQAPLLKEAQEMLVQWEAGDKNVRDLWQTMNTWVYAGFDITYTQLGITFDKTYYESDTYHLGKQIVQNGLQQGIFYPKEDGSIWVDLTQDGLDEKLLLRANGTSVYITQDLGTAELRYTDFKADKMVYVVANEQDYHFNVLAKILTHLSRPYAAGIQHLSYGMVDLPTGKMKSREGTVVDADELMAEMIQTAEEHTQILGKIEDFSAEEAQQLYHAVGIGALKYFLLRVDAQKRIVFDPKASIDLKGDTSTFIQYTYARIQSILYKAQQQGLSYHHITISQRTALHPLERKLIVQATTFPAKLQEAAHTYAPSVIAQYALDLAKAYNKIYATLPILTESNHEQQVLRLQLSDQLARTLQNILKLLGINTPHKM